MSRKFSLNTVEGLYFFVAFGSAVLGFIEKINPSIPSGRWAWVHILAENTLGENGYVKFLIFFSIFWLIIFIINYIPRVFSKEG